MNAKIGFVTITDTPCSRARPPTLHLRSSPVHGVGSYVLETISYQVPANEGDVVYNKDIERFRARGYPVLVDGR